MEFSHCCNPYVIFYHSCLDTAPFLCGAALNGMASLLLRRLGTAKKGMPEVSYENLIKSFPSI